MNGVEDLPPPLAALHAGGWHAGPPPPLGQCRHRWRFPSSYREGELAVDALAAQLVAWGWVPAAERDMLAHCLLEAVANALDHGHGLDLRREVDVSVWQDGASWHVVVRDQGDGFPRERLPRAVADQPRGRGMLIIGSWFDRLDYWLGGRCAVMSRRRHDAGG